MRKRSFLMEVVYAVFLFMNFWLARMGKEPEIGWALWAWASGAVQEFEHTDHHFF